jgi:Na+-driven multidrug efflux pump
MAELLVILTPIALIDSTSIVPLLLVPLAILYYNVIFIAPLIALVLLRQALPGLADRMFGALSRAAETWGARVILMLLLALGTVMILDGVGWFMGRPLIRIGL